MRRLILWLSAGAFVAVAALVAATIVYVFPASDEVEHANAVIVLGPATSDRVALGQQLVDEGRADRMIISAGRPGWAYDKASIPECRDRTADCFMPVPATTSGEALKIQEIAERDSWTSVTVITATPHVARADHLRVLQRDRRERRGISDCARPGDVALRVRLPDGRLREIRPRRLRTTRRGVEARDGARN